MAIPIITQVYSTKSEEESWVFMASALLPSSGFMFNKATGHIRVDDGITAADSPAVGASNQILEPTSPETADTEDDKHVHFAEFEQVELPLCEVEYFKINPSVNPSVEFEASLDLISSDDASDSPDEQTDTDTQVPDNDITSNKSKTVEPANGDLSSSRDHALSTQATSDESAPAETSADKPASDEPAPELASVTTMEPHTHATTPPKERTSSVVINDLGAALSARHRARAGATTSGEWRARGSPQQQRMIHHLCSLEFVKYYTSEAWTISEPSL